MNKVFLTRMMGTTLSILVLAFPSTSMGNNLENLAKSLAKLRGEVETLQTQLDMEKKNTVAAWLP